MAGGIVRRPMYKDHTGREHNGLTFLHFVERDGDGKPVWKLRCHCGVEFTARANNVLTGGTSSCGCVRRRSAAETGRRCNTTHGACKTPEYQTWDSMKDRCLNSTVRQYRNYGGRGIKVCERWLGENGFRNFLADMGPRPSDKHSLDRINNDGDYEPGNCRWATWTEQSNNRCNNRRVTYQGREQSAAEWAREMGLPPRVVQGRLIRGWSVEDALTRPVANTGPRAQRSS